MTSKEKPSQKQLDSAYRKALHTFGSRPEVTAVDTGFKYVGGKRTEQIAIRIHVREKKPVSGLESAQLFPEQIDGVPTDVIQAVYEAKSARESSLDRTRRLDPIQPGISVGHFRESAGTFGAVVYDSLSGRAGMLSNWHVLAGQASARPGDAITQPGPFDGGRTPNDTVGKLERMILDSDGDAAFAYYEGPRAVRDDQFATGVVVRSARTAVTGDVVEKSGRSTDVTRGQVDGTGRYFIDYSVGRVGIDGFKIVPLQPDNPADEEISAAGDSGSLWYDPETGQGIGLHFAGETNTAPSAEHAVACHLPRVLNALNLSLTSSLVPDRSADGSRASSQAKGAENFEELVRWMHDHRQAVEQLLGIVRQNQ